MLTTRQFCTWKPVMPDVWWNPSKMLLSSGLLPSLPGVVEGVSCTLLQDAATHSACQAASIPICMLWVKCCGHHLMVFVPVDVPSATDSPTSPQCLAHRCCMHAFCSHQGSSP